MGRIVSNAFAGLVAAFFVLPIFAIVPAAFNRASYIKIPPDDWSLRWWSTFFADPSWQRALENSLKVAVLSALLAVVVGVAAALGIARLRGKIRALVTGLFLGPAIVPVIVLAVSLYGVVRSLGLLGTTTGLVLAHAMLALPYVTLNTSVSLAALDPRLELAAAGLGAGPLADLPDRHLAADRTRHLRRRDLFIRDVVRRSGAVGLPDESIDEDIAGPHVGGHPGRICSDCRGGGDDHDRSGARRRRGKPSGLSQVNGWAPCVFPELPDRSAL